MAFSVLHSVISLRDADDRIMKASGRAVGFFVVSIKKHSQTKVS